MRVLIFILLISLNYLLFSEPASIIDFIKKEKVETVWTDIGDYSISNIKADPRGISKEYDGMLFYKYKYDAIFIDKNNGNVFQRMWQSLEGSIDQGGYPYGIHIGNWDLSPTDTSNIFVGEYGVTSYELSKIISYSGNNIDTVFTWLNQNKNYIREVKGEYYFNVINKNQFLTQFEAIEIIGPYRVNRRETYFINNTKDSIEKFEKINLETIEYNQSKNRFITTTTNEAKFTNHGQTDDPDSHDFFYIKDNLCSQIDHIDIFSNKWFKGFINDSISLYRNKDTIFIFDTKHNEQIANYYINPNSTILGMYFNNILNISNLIINTEEEGKQIFSIHIPTNNVVLNRLINAPYLGKPITKLDNGYQLSIGDNHYLYRHKNDIFKYDSVTVDFDYTNTSNNIVEFEEATFGAVIKWHWDFGDGNISENSNPSHQYLNAGNFIVSLSVEDAFGNKDTITKTIRVEDKLNSSFDFVKFSGKAPLSIEFQNYSSANSIKYIWNFGDGTYSYDKSPSHIYTSAGTYTVSLTVMDEEGNFHTQLSPKQIIVTP